MPLAFLIAVLPFIIKLVGASVLPKPSLTLALLPKLFPTIQLFFRSFPYSTHSAPTLDRTWLAPLPLAFQIAAFTIKTKITAVWALFKLPQAALYSPWAIRWPDPVVFWGFRLHPLKKRSFRLWSFFTQFARLEMLTIPYFRLLAFPLQA